MKKARFFLEPKTASFLAQLGEYLNRQGVQSYLVGGYVRDGLIGRGSGDIDIAVAGEALSIARQTADAFQGKFVVLDERNKIARVVFPEEGWHLDFTAMRGNIEQDLAHRDFTIDAMAIELHQIAGDLTQLEVIDPFAGSRDLERGLIRAVSDSAFKEDPLRLLRAVRLQAELGFTIDDGTESMIKDHCHLIINISGERIRDELCYALATARAASSLRRLDQLGLLFIIMPELKATKGATQPKEHFWDVFEHSLETVAAGERLLQSLPPGRDEILPPTPWSSAIADHFDREVSAGRNRRVLFKLAALFHDMAKPMTRSVEENGKVRFLGHGKEGAQMAASIMERLRFGSREIKMAAKMVTYHLRPGQLSNTDDMPTHRAIYRYFRDTAEVGIDTLFLSLADHLATRGPMLDPEEWQRDVQKTQYIISKWFEEQTVVLPTKLVSGHDLIRRFGLSPGPQIGNILEAVREAQAAGDVKTKEQALAFAEKVLRRGEIAT
jgi:poly(A) polymerase